MSCWLMPFEELLAGLAEECGELTQAALKLRRTFNQVNPTPVSEDAAIDKLYEEIADVLLYIDELKLCKEEITRIKAYKKERWLKRLESAKK